MSTGTRAYFVGGGIGSLAAAAFMIRDGGFAGQNISIFEAASVMGGSLDGAAEPVSGYSLRGGRMFTTDNYECTWDLFRSIPSLNDVNKTVFEETVESNEKHRSNSMARLVDRRRAKVPVTSMGFSMQDRVELLKLSSADEGSLGASRITDWLSPGFFETEFWYMWATTFAFQPWHSAVEFKRYLHRFMLEFTRIDTLAGVKRTVYNQYDSLVLSLQTWLAAQGVHLLTGCKVTDLDHRLENGKFTVTGLRCLRDGKNDLVAVNDTDLVFVQNGSMTDASSLGSMTRAPAEHTKADSGGWALWEKLAAGRPEFGNPAAFNDCIAQSCWESFTVTLKNPAFFEEMNRFSGNEAGTGGLVTFKDSNWLMSIVLAHQPHFLNQPADVQVFWGYALLPDRIENFVPKAMDECTGAEILRELCGHLRFDLEVVESATLQLGRRYGVALLLESALLCVSVPLFEHGNVCGVYTAACACGLQNAMVSTYSGAAVRTTHVSGMFTDLGIFLGHALRGLPVDSRRLRLCYLIISGFLCGGIAGAVAFRSFGYAALFFPGGLTAMTSLVYGVYELRKSHHV